MQLRALILTGPHMSPAERADLMAQAAACPVEILSSSEDATLLLRQAAAVVTMAGYNSLCEVLALRKKALVIPRSGPSAEQRIRSQIFSQQRLIRMLDPDHLAPERLAHELMQLLTDDNIPNPANIPPLDGRNAPPGCSWEKTRGSRSCLAQPRWRQQCSSKEYETGATMLYRSDATERWRAHPAFVTPDLLPMRQRLPSWKVLQRSRPRTPCGWPAGYPPQEPQPNPHRHSGRGQKRPGAARRRCRDQLRYAHTAHRY